MREIKFRAWLDDGYNKWMVDDFYIHSDGTIYEEAFTTYDTPNKEIEQAYNLTVMQYTGYKDKNGVEIYEGDILKLTSININKQIGRASIMQLRFVSGGFAICFNCGTFSRWLRDILLICESEVIGNIYGNPELLEE